MDKTIFTTRVRTNLNGVLQMTQTINGILMTGDNAANQIIVELFDDYEKVVLANDAKLVGYFIRSDGYTVEVDGSVDEEGNAVVIIPEVAYEVSGSLSMAVRLFEGEHTVTARGYYDSEGKFIIVTDPSQETGPDGEPIITTEVPTWDTKIVIAALSCYIQVTESNSIIDPTHHIPDVQELLAYLDQVRRTESLIEEAEGLRVIAEAGRVEAENLRVLAENLRVSQESTRESNEVTRQSQESSRQLQEATRQSNESTRQSQESTRELNESTRQSQETSREQAQAQRNAAIDGMTVAATGLSPYSEPTVSISEVSGHKHIVFGLTPGDPFVIVKTFPSIAEMEAYTGTDLRVGQFVLITSNVEDPDNAKMFCVATVSPNTFTFATDLSGAQGIVGPQGETGVGISSIVLNQDYTITVNYTDGNSWTSLNSIRGEKGEKGDTGNGISSIVLNQDYTVTVTYTDGTSWTSPNSIRGEKGETGTGISSIVLNQDYTVTVNYTDGTSWTSPNGIRGEKGETGETGNGIASAELTSENKIRITYTDGTVWTSTESVKGDTGDTGPTGNGIASIVQNEDKTLTITMTDGTTYTTAPAKGEPGLYGIDFNYNQETMELTLGMY